MDRPYAGSIVWAKRIAVTNWYMEAKCCLEQYWHNAAVSQAEKRGSIRGSIHGLPCLPQDSFFTTQRACYNESLTAENTQNTNINFTVSFYFIWIFLLQNSLHLRNDTEHRHNNTESLPCKRNKVTKGQKQVTLKTIKTIGGGHITCSYSLYSFL